MKRTNLNLSIAFTIIICLMLCGCQRGKLDAFSELLLYVEENYSSPGIMPKTYVLVDDRLAEYSLLFRVEAEQLQLLVGETYQKDAVLLSIYEHLDLQEPIDIVDLAVLEKTPTELIFETQRCNWYIPVGRTNLQYLIQELENGKFSAWEYDRLIYIDSDSMPLGSDYLEIYKNVYPDATVFSESTKEEENRLIFSD